MSTKITLAPSRAIAAAVAKKCERAGDYFVASFEIQRHQCQKQGI